MLFTSDTTDGLAAAATLVNTRRNGVDTLETVADLDALLRVVSMSGERLGTQAEVDAVREIRERLRALWSATDRAEAAGLVNAILAETTTTPYLTKHDELDWHLHMTEQDAPLAHRMGAEAAMGVLDLIRTDNLARLRTCAADDCDAVLVDLSRNSSKRYCDTGNCGNRANVAAYRARRRESGEC
ncbi:CGNR zinc finger domain-containing protein [Microlunatus flavus]|uniref:Putative stress-induced transcription regulator n=1 Tax=Microlunatus flavus TaxID=1036181 RepID=A0A1H9NMY1_9ACTN|nr:CGNR zinc finger domain-containing protein [Microlunatus flavus]SER37251.1 Putative stress-induced transcription regulator [Microlunatus flavus]